MDELNFSDRFLKSFRSGEVIFEEGSFGKMMYVIQSGQVNIVRKRGSDTVTLGTLMAGDMFGEMALVEHQPRAASAVAASDDTALIEIDHAHFIYLVAQQPAFALMVLKTLSQRLRNEMAKTSPGGGT